MRNTRPAGFAIRQIYRDNRIIPYSVVGGKFCYSVREIEELMKKNYVPASL